MHTNRETPCSTDAEIWVIEQMLFEPENTVKAVIDAGGETLFYDTKHTILFKAIEHIYEHDGTIDQLTLSEYLKSTGKLEKIGGDDFIAELLLECTSAANIMAHISLLREKSQLRKADTLWKTVLGMVHDQNATSEAIIEYVDAQLTDIKEHMKEKRSLADEVREWVLSTEGHFESTTIHRELNLSTRVHKKNCSEILRRLCAEGIIERYGDRSGSFRTVENNCDKITWEGANMESLNIKFPFNIEDLVEIMPGNIVVVAGEQNAGKTAFLLNMVRQNMDRYDTHYFSSEMGAPELKKRIMKFNDIPIRDWHFKAWERSQKFADVIKPDSLNIIDFLEVHDEFYKVGAYLKQIHDKLGKGIAVVGLQKTKGAETGRGGSMSLEKPRLYLTMEPGKLRIMKAKNFKNPDVNPNGLFIEYKLVNGCLFKPTNGWQREK